jgi:transketolase
MSDWVDGPLALEYSMGSDWDNRWRTGGTLDEVMDEAHLTPPHLLAGIERFVRERASRLQRVRNALEAAESRGSAGSTSGR